MPQAPFFGENDVPGFFETCNSPVELFLRAAGDFFSAKMPFLRFVRHVIALLKSFYVPQALFLPANSDSQMALAIFVMGEES